MRITINYFEGYPELEAELAKHSPRARAERLRFLAAMGLAFMRDGRPHVPVVSASEQPAAPHPPSPHPATGSPTSSAAKSLTRNVFRQADE